MRPKVAAGRNKMAYLQPEIFIHTLKMHPFATPKSVRRSQNSALNGLCAFLNKLIYIEYYGGVKKKCSRRFKILKKIITIPSAVLSSDKLKGTTDC